jgi:hypothetical protein
VQPASFTTSVKSSGQNPIISNVTISGHAGASFLLFKETSTALVKGYEGTCSTTLPESGTFDIVLSRSTNIYGFIVRKNGVAGLKYSLGTLSGDQLKDTKDNVIEVLTGDKIKRDFTNGGNNKVTVRGKRSL